MANHFSTIGIPLTSRDQFAEYAQLSVRKGERIKTSKGTYTKFEMGQGVELWGQLSNDNEIIGINPHFTGNAVLMARLINKVDDPNDNDLDGKIYAQAEPDADGGFTYPFVFDMPDLTSYKFAFPQIEKVQLSAFAHELSVYKDDEEYDHSQAGDPKFASESFIPSGLFFPDGKQMTPPQATAIFTGHILCVEKIQNAYTGAFFYHAKVKTLGGEIDMVADPELVDHEICVGGVVSGSFWLSGRLIKRKFKLFR